MAKRNLARTAIEGGRTGEDKRWRKEHIEHHRRVRRAANHRMKIDPSTWDDVDFSPLHPTGWRDNKFKDKLNPVERWLEKQVGRQWDDIYSEVRQRFDARTTAGRHILFDHLLGYVEFRSHRLSYASYLVDADGVLQKGPWKRYRYYNRDKNPMAVKRPVEEIREFIKGRKIRVVGPALFWALPVNPGWRYCKDHWNCPYEHRVSETPEYRTRRYVYKNLIYEHWGSLHYVQHTRLTDEEVRFWGSLEERFRESIRV